ncbi:protein windbeutel [Teleopsis dalmanni]|uniref:protein windbeutel n=1 Tax=Teleopsis dalmanni TaxID=139649 RepID=UPI0018CD5FC0|nr:protein windbeutel [Teleopsis dalmanni]
MCTSRNYLKLCAVLFLLLSTLSCSVWAISCAGCVDLDEVNFDKTVLRFPYALVKFDIAFPYGEKHEAFAAFSKTAHQVTDELLVATVGIKDYGEMENKLLGDRYKVDDKAFPAIFLFKGSSDKYVQFPTYLDVTLDNLKKFVTENSELYIGREGCLKAYNLIIKNYANLSNELQLEKITEAEEALKSVTRENEKINARNYLLFMRKINEKGYEFVDEETKRLQRLRAGKVAEAKKVELTHKLNVLESFRVAKLTKEATKQEL